MRPSRALLVGLLGWLLLRAGEAPATVAEQRARLPPAAECDSEVEGKWLGLVWSAVHRGWYEFRLEIHQADGDESQLSGTIKVHAWRGPSDQPEPPATCTGLRFKGSMNARGTYVNGEIAFGGIDWNLDELICGSGVGYNLDNFTGRIDDRIHEFQSVNNDGGSAVDEPTVFRRIGCFDEEPKVASVDVKAPDFYPKRRRSGCSVTP